MEGDVDMTFRQIEFFVAAGKYGSINKAAESVRLSQQAISKALRELEMELGCKLMTRTTTGITLTDYGRYVFQAFEQLIANRDGISAQVLKMKEHKKEHLSVGISIGALSCFPHWMVPHFSEQYPNISLHYEDYMDKVLEQKLVNNEYDLAIIFGPFTNDKLWTQSIKRERVFLCIPQGHHLYESEQISMQQLKQEQFVMFSNLFNLHHNFISSCYRSGFEPNITMTSNDCKSIKEIAYFSGGLFLMPETMIRNGDTRFRYVPFPDPFLSQDLMLVMNANKYVTKTMEQFIDYIMNVNTEDQPLQERRISG